MNNGLKIGLLGLLGVAGAHAATVELDSSKMKSVGRGEIQRLGDRVVTQDAGLVYCVEASTNLFPGSG